MLNFFKRVPVKTIADELIYEAERKLIEHQTAAEHHAALATMYKTRITRMRTEHDATEPQNNEPRIPAMVMNVLRRHEPSAHAH